eukprot:TRINITY_DN27866_c0_g1_i1.p2 TRINITY_DN27866_c0_g1~~TRINITY_DN27866_c0_g1_i1.p2  ORF type:complete len:231 (+),score=55.69 TRINITY_DN27866_c0_g1_i1:23-694(+)
MAGGKGAGKKGGGLGSEEEAQEQEWTCHMCRTNNFPTRPTCRSCNEPWKPPTTMQNAYSYKGTNVEHIRRGTCWNCGSSDHVKAVCPYLDEKSSPTICPCEFQLGYCPQKSIGCPYLGLPVSACCDYLKGSCTKPTCTFAHLAPPACPHVFQKGYCTFGEQCALVNRPVDECSFATCMKGEECRRRHTYHTVAEQDGQIVHIHPTKHQAIARPRQAVFPGPDV